VSKLVFHTSMPPRMQAGGPIHAVLYGGASYEGAPRVGGPVLDAVRRLGYELDSNSFDFLTVALAVTAADTFVKRSVASDVGWERDLHITVPLKTPQVWTSLTPLLREALGFLTGDRWDFDFGEGGLSPPSPMTRGHLVMLDGVNLVSLFSGGLDSAIGVLTLVKDGFCPLLVSHAYPKDAKKQVAIREKVFSKLPRFAANLRPVWPASGGFDTTMRGRSFDFLALAAVAANTVGRVNKLNVVRLVIPENGFIAVNAPLSVRRIGSLSTRTTHPHFLEMMQRIFDRAGISARLENPYEFSTKGEMVRSWAQSPLLSAISGNTVSCGRWKRRNKQCGQCIPCLIRRASFHAAGLADPTMPQYENITLTTVLKNPDPAARGDLLALMRATGWIGTSIVRRQVGASGPLPSDPVRRKLYEDVVERGLQEAKVFLAAAGLPV
jgi:hypothetical protein